MSNPADEIIRALGAMVHRAQRQSDEIQAAMAANATTAEHELLTLSLAGGQLSDIAFTDAAVSISPVKLRNAILDTYRQAQARTADTTAVDLARITGIPEMADAVRSHLPEDVTATLSEQEATGDGSQAPRSSTDTSPTGAGPDNDESPAGGRAEDEAAGEELLARYREAEERGRVAGALHIDASLESLFADEPDFLDRRARGEGVGGDWGQRMNQAIEAAAERGRQRAARLETAEGTAESRLFRITATGFGQLVDVTVLGSARGTAADELSSDFLDVARRAAAEAFEGRSDLGELEPHLPRPRTTDSPS